MNGTSHLYLKVIYEEYGAVFQKGKIYTCSSNDLDSDFNASISNFSSSNSCKSIKI